MSPLIYASVVKLLGQLQTADDTTENQLLRGSAYVTLGTIGKRMPHLLTQTGDLGILEMLFNRISAEPEAGASFDVFCRIGGRQRSIYRGLPGHVCDSQRIGTRRAQAARAGFQVPVRRPERQARDPPPGQRGAGTLPPSSNPL